VGEYLGIDISSGKEDVIAGISEQMEESVFFHRVQIRVEEHWVIEVNAGFVKGLSFSAVLGREGFFDNFRIQFDHSADPPFFEIEKIPVIQ